jgi:hypothetical protein
MLLMILLQYHLLYNSNKIYQHESLYALWKGLLISLLTLYICAHSSAEDATEGSAEEKHGLSAPPENKVQMSAEFPDSGSPVVSRRPTGLGVLGSPLLSSSLEP